MASLLSSLSDTVRPATIFASAAALTVVGLHFPPKYHKLFFAPTFLLTLWSFFSINVERRSVDPMGLEGYMGITCFIYMLILPRILIFQTKPLVAKNDSPEKREGVQDIVLCPSRASISKACWIWNNPRHLPTKARAGSAPWSEVLAFLLSRGFKIGALVLMDQFVVDQVRENLKASSSITDFLPDQEPIVRRIWIDYEDAPVSAHQLVLRAVMSVSWIWANVLVLECCHAALSVVFVALLRLDDPEDWPPLFGSPLDAWSVRRFWSRFWHRIATPTFGAWAGYLTHSVSRCEPGTPVAKAVGAFGIFLLSGVAHATVAWTTGQGYPLRDLLFFCANFVAVGFEILILGAVKNAVRKTRYEAWMRDPRVQALGKMLGFLEVFAWFFWAVPRWMYPKTFRASIRQVVLHYYQS